MSDRILKFALILCLIAAAACTSESNLEDPQTNTGPDAQEHTDTDPQEDASLPDASDSDDVSQPSGPAITGVDLVRSDGPGEENLDIVQTLEDGTEINLSEFGGLLNIVASATEDVTGSVHFELDGPTAIDRHENDPPFTMAETGSHLDTSASEPAEGDYTLTITPYSKPDMTGDTGPSQVISFSVIDEGDVIIINDGGFTEIAPSDDSLLIYVSSSEGDDNNDCLSPAEPCETISAGTEKLRDDSADHLYLKRGDIWREQHLSGIPSGRSNDEPTVVAYYGESGERPKLEVSNSSTIGNPDPGFIHIIGLEFSSYKLDPDDPDFDGNDDGGFILIQNQHDILFEDCFFDHFEVAAHPFEGSAPRDLTFRRNIWNGAYINTSSYGQNPRPSNIYAAVPGLVLIENVFDHGGWHDTVEGAAANQYNHNIYLQNGVDGAEILIQNNIVTRGSSHGIQMRSGGLAENNFFGRNAVSLMMGYWDPTMVDGVRAYAFNNVMSEGHSMVKGHDPCQGNNLCTGALWGVELDLRGGNADWQVRDNIISNTSPDDDQTLYDNLNAQGLKNTDEPNVQTSNNLVWQWATPTEGSDQNYSDPGRTLGDYNASLGGTNSFDEFMEVVLNREVGTWDERYTAAEINDYIRAGFDL